MKTVFVVIPWFYPAYKAGGPIQSIVNMVECFSNNISYKIICSATDLGGGILPVTNDKWIQYNAYTKVWYSSKNKKIISLLQKEATSEDIVFINGIYSWNFNLLPILFCNSPRKIISVRGMLHPGALSQKQVKKKLYISLFKLFGLHKQCEFHASNSDEKRYIESTFGNNIKVYIAQNFPRFIKTKLTENKLPDSLNLLSIALISPMKNHLLVLKALAHCNKRINYNIYGPIKDTEYWEMCTKQIKNLPENINVKYHGDISPAGIDNVLSENHVFILPSKSENFGHAIYEALSSAKPVITSENTPWTNLKKYKAGINTSIENSNEILVAINFFCDMDQNEFKEWTSGASQYALNAIDTNEIRKQYKTMFIT